MLEKCRAIVLRKVPFRDSGAIITCYTDVFGLQSYLIKGLQGKKSGIRPSHVMLMNVLRLEVYHKAGHSLQHIRELRCDPVWQHIHVDIYRSTVSIFMSEVLVKTISEEQHPDLELFAYLESILQLLDQNEISVAHFPVYFMAHLASVLGIAPNTYEALLYSGAEGLKESLVFMDRAMQTILQTPISEYFTLAYPAAVRKQLLEWLVQHFQTHIGGFSGLKSLDVFEAIFHES